MNDNPIHDREQESSQRFIEKLAEHYQPAPFEPAQRARFDAGLRERIERRQPQRAWLPALAGAAATFALAWWVWPVAPALTPAPASFARAPIEATWETEVVLVDADSTLAEVEYLPDEYQVIEMAFLDGV